MASYTSTQHAVSRLGDTFGAFAFTGAQAHSVGVNRRQLMYLANQGLIARLHRDSYCLDDTFADHAATLEACEFVQQHGVTPVIGAAAAAAVWGLETSSARSLIWVPGGGPIRRGNRGGVTIREGHIDDECRVHVRDSVFTSPIRTAVDLACEVTSPGEITWMLCQGLRRECEWLRTGSLESRLTAHQLIDALGHEPERQALQCRLFRVLKDHHGRGITCVKQWAGIIDPRLESALEAESWVAFHRDRLPVPHPQVLVRGASGRWYRADFGWGRVIGEADGAVKYRDPADLWKEKRRQEDLEQAGFIIVRWTWAEITHEPHRVIERILRALARANS